jgi:hypothetical protein
VTPRTSILRTLRLACAPLALALPVAAADAEDSRRVVVPDAKSSGAEPGAGPDREDEAPAATAVYRPPRRGSARARIGGGTRGVSKTPHVRVLAPDHVGLTTRAQPVLGWFVSATTDQRIDFTLTRRDDIDPVVETTLPAPTRAGVQLVALADFDVELEPGAVYEWSIAVVVDPEERDRDVFASGSIELAAVTAPLVADLETMASHRAFAHHGVWYDAIADLSQSTDADDSRALRLERAQLFEQVDLTGVAKFERDLVASR